jgi:hypothetical protein
MITKISMKKFWEDIDEGGKITSKWILKKEDGKVWIGFM